MFATTSERSMRAVRYTLAAGWLVLIASLFHDPISSALTRPGASHSPFRIDRTATSGPVAERYACPVWVEDPATGGSHIDWGAHAAGTCDERCPSIQGECLVNEPYPLGARVWWTLLFPLIPMFLLVFGHEAWRRICPLAALSQIPRLLGRQRKRKVINPETGLVERKLVLVAPDSWLARNAWYVQFGLLWAGVSARLLLVNSDRVGLGLFLSGWIVSSMAVGYLLGGKSWCNYFCPISPVQRVYTEPRGLLESRAHVSLRVITGSMCRTTADAAGKEQSACVGCKSPCPDVDLERAYWTEGQSASRRFVYYGYFGLVVGFYTYYRLYSGTWSYYFSGAWTHERGVRDALFAPGFYLFGRAIDVPKLVAAPLTVAMFILAAYALGVGLERAYGFLRKRAGAGISPAESRHHALSASTFATFLAFYQFGGRPNINLLPPVARTVIDALIVFTASLWLVQSLSRSSQRYERESLGSSLRKQLKKLRLDLTKLLGGRTLDELAPDEVYVLAKTLPELSAQQRRDTYKETVREALRNGSATTAAGLAVLEEMREQLSITEAEHGAVLTELGIEDQKLLDPQAKQSQENWLRLNSYREALEALVLDLVNSGVPVQEALRRDDVLVQVRRLQTLYSITADEQERAVAELFGAQSGILREARTLVARVSQLGARTDALALVAEGAASWPVRLLLAMLSDQRRTAVERVLIILSAAGPTPEAMDMAETLARAAPNEIDAVLQESEGHPGRDWHAELAPAVYAALERKTLDPNAGARPSMVEPRPTPAEALRQVITEREPIARAVALYALARHDPDAGIREAERVLESGEGTHWLVRETAESVRTLRQSQLGVRAAGDLDTMEKLLRLFEGTLFHHMPPESLAQLAREAKGRVLPRGSVLCEQGEPSHELLLLSRGGAEVSVAREGEAVVVGRVVPGQTIGELGVLTRAPRSATVRASEDGTEVVAIPGERLESMLLQDGRIATGLLRTVSQRLSATLAAPSPPRAVRPPG